MRKGHGRKLSYYDLGATPFFACARDPRFSYCLYVPETYDEDASDDYALVVLIHGTERGAATYRDRFVEFAEEHRCIVLAPLFPANIGGPGDLDNYKLIEFQGIRFDRILLSMVEEVQAKYRIRPGGMLMHGFSGGGHFTHRFLYLHPGQLAAASIGAPGVVTVFDQSRDWWVGVRNLEQVFGIAPDPHAMRHVAVQTVVGGEDTDTWEITIPESSPWWMEGANSAGATRIDRIQSLARSLEAYGISVRADVVPGVAHNGWAVLDPVKDFFASVLVARSRKGVTP